MKMKDHYFPDNTNENIIKAISDYADSYFIADILSKGSSEFRITKAAANQKGFTITNKSIAFRILLDYKGKEGCTIINFPTWRGWENILPLDAKNHFYVGGRRDYSKENGLHNCYYHSFKFKSEQEFLEFFNKYILTFSLAK